MCLLLLSEQHSGHLGRIEAHRRCRTASALACCLCYSCCNRLPAISLCEARVPLSWVDDAMDWVRRRRNEGVHGARYSSVQDVHQRLGCRGQARRTRCSSLCTSVWLAHQMSGTPPARLGYPCLPIQQACVQMWTWGPSIVPFAGCWLKRFGTDRSTSAAPERLASSLPYWSGCSERGSAIWPGLCCDTQRTQNITNASDETAPPTAPPKRHS